MTYDALRGSATGLCIVDHPLGKKKGRRTVIDYGDGNETL